MLKQERDGRPFRCLESLLLTSAALLRAHLLRAQVGSVIVRFVEVILLLFAFLEEKVKAVRHRVGLFLIICTCRNLKCKEILADNSLDSLRMLYPYTVRCAHLVRLSCQFFL